MAAVTEAKPMEPLTDAQIAKFQQALEGPAPKDDPNWRVTQGLIKVIVMQAQEMKTLMARLEVFEEANEATTRNLVTALQQSAGGQVTKSGVTQAEVDGALADMNSAIETYRSGATVAKYAGQALKYAALFI